MKALALSLFVLSFSAQAGLRDVEFIEQPGAELPLNVEFREDGRPAPLHRYFGRSPVVIELGYLSCLHLCSTTRMGVMEVLSRTGLEAGRDYTALFVSIDPRDESGPPQRREGWHVLTGATPAAVLAGRIGFRYGYEAASGEFAHPAGFVVVTPEGRVAQYFGGVRFDAQAVREALVAAANGRKPSVIERVLLVCFHDPVSGRYNSAILDALRVAAALFLAALAFFAWRRR
ncbi:MAG: SCO family protein [Betaproteobacteria bacterium]|nr:SCO family protein [Betaproteobacteria bacterium]